MRIGEVAQRTGLSISNIRFYEKKGLIGPERNEQNRYREYEEEDVQQLEKIILYRKMDFTIETIAELLDHKVDVQQALIFSYALRLAFRNVLSYESPAEYQP